MAVGGGACDLAQGIVLVAAQVWQGRTGAVEEWKDGPYDDRAASECGWPR